MASESSRRPAEGDDQGAHAKRRGLARRVHPQSIAARARHPERRPASSRVLRRNPAGPTNGYRPGRLDRGPSRPPPVARPIFIHALVNGSDAAAQPRRDAAGGMALAGVRPPAGRSNTRQQPPESAGSRVRLFRYHWRLACAGRPQYCRRGARPVYVGGPCRPWPSALARPALEPRRNGPVVRIRRARINLQGLVETQWTEAFRHILLEVSPLPKAREGGRRSHDTPRGMD